VDEGPGWKARAVAPRLPFGRRLVNLRADPRSQTTARKGRRPRQAARGACVSVAILLVAATPAPSGGDEHAPAAGDPRPAPYVYEPAGRRDPFISLLARRTTAESGATRATGPAGLRLNEFGLRGVLQAGDRHIAMIQATDGRSFLLRPGDRLLDATVQDISAEAVVFLQDGEGPLAPARAREVVRTLRPAVEER
jgi:hypothetical protein